MTAQARFTVLGASGFIGSRLVAAIRASGFECVAVNRNDLDLPRGPLGHLIYCIGVTADFRSRPYDTARAHVCRLADVLENANFESFLYLSSTRVYFKSGHTQEDGLIQVNPLDSSDYYNLTKLTGEALCISSGHKNVRVARLSNVYGDDFQSSNFLTSIIRDAVLRKHVTLQTSPKSSKDYIALEDVLAILPQIALAGKHPVYNVAAGCNVTNAEVLNELSRVAQCEVDYLPEAPTISFPSIDISRLRTEFGFTPRTLIEHLPQLVRQFEKAQA